MKELQVIIAECPRIKCKIYRGIPSWISKKSKTTPEENFLVESLEIIRDGISGRIYGGILRKTSKEIPGVMKKKHFFKDFPKKETEIIYGIPEKTAEEFLRQSM